MKIKLIHIIILTLLLSINLFLEPTSLLAAVPGGFNQPTNQDIKKRFENIEQKQRDYDMLLSLLLWNFYQLQRDNQLERDDARNHEINKKLAWVIETNKSSYLPGEPVGISVSRRNISMEDVDTWGTVLTRGFFLYSMKITRTWRGNKQEVFLTQRGNSSLNVLSVFSVLNGAKFVAEKGAGHMKPGDKIEIYHPFKTLNLYYDLSLPGEYELTFYTRNFLGTDEEQIGEYPKPCTVRFKIEDGKDWLDNHVRWEKSEVNSP